MPFRNRIRLPFYVTRPQFPTESTNFRLANGARKTLSSVVRKVFEGETENLPREIHERLVIALKHDDVTIEGKYYLGGISLEGDYDVEWNKFLDYPLGKAVFKVEVTPFNYSNDNCQTCEDLSQVVCVDDNIGTVNEGDTVTVHPLANDSICCSPVTISLVTYNSDYLASCIVSGNDIIIEAKPSLTDANSIVLVTYRAECPNGSYDEANIIGDITGTDPTPTCLAPISPAVVSLDSDTSATFSWTAPSPAPSCGYHWMVTDNLGVVTLNSGDTSIATVQVTGLPSNSLCKFYVRSNCCSLNSNYAGPVVFSLPPPGGSDFCGLYELFNSTPVTKAVTYMDCTASSQTEYIPPFQQREICMLQSGPGSPTELIPEVGINVVYLGLC